MPFHVVSRELSNSSSLIQIQFQMKVSSSESDKQKSDSSPAAATTLPSLRRSKAKTFRKTEQRSSSICDKAILIMCTRPKVQGGAVSKQTSGIPNYIIIIFCSRGRASANKNELSILSPIIHTRMLISMSFVFENYFPKLFFISRKVCEGRRLSFYPQLNTG